jgi:hypothetical protein
MERLMMMQPIRRLRSPQRSARQSVAVILAAGLIVGAVVGYAAAGDDAGSAGAYARYGASARSLSLGNAVTGICDDVATSYWNPAGLAGLRTMELTGMGATLFEDTQYGFLALGMPTERWGTFNFGATLTRSGEYERADLSGDLGETFSEREGIFQIGYANGGHRWTYGLTLKHVSQDIGGSKGSGVGMDAGLYFRPHRNLSFGAAVQNFLQPKVILETDEEKLARSIRGGIALRFFNNRLMVMSDLVKTDFMDMSLRSGLEMWPLRGMALRGGFDSEREMWSVGAGLRWENWQFDYAFLDTDLGAQNVLSATLRFGVPYGVKMHRDKALFSPSGTDRDVTFEVQTALRTSVDSWRLEIVDPEGKVVRTMQGNGAPPEGITWGGEDDQGRLVPDGDYEANMVILDDLGQEWDYQTSVEVLGFQDRTRVPVRVKISGTGEAPEGGSGR